MLSRCLAYAIPKVPSLAGYQVQFTNALNRTWSE
jgi:hypothetical protein